MPPGRCAPAPQGGVRASGKAEGAVVLPLSILPLKADPHQPDPALKKGVPVVVYCASGARSGLASGRNMPTVRFAGLSHAVATRCTSSGRNLRQ